MVNIDLYYDNYSDNYSDNYYNDYSINNCLIIFKKIWLKKSI